MSVSASSAVIRSQKASNKAMLLEEITKDIISDAMFVLNELKPGLYEKLQEKAFVAELPARGRVTGQRTSCWPEDELLARGRVVESQGESASGGNQLTSRIWHAPESRLVQIGESP